LNPERRHSPRLGGLPHGKVRPSMVQKAMVVPLAFRKKQAEFSGRDSIQDCW
jgi:hypothetical protein